MASGCPVIAYAKGGALETVIEKKTGLFFDEQNAESLAGAIQKMQNIKFDSNQIRAHAETFDEQVFKEKMINFLEKKWEMWQKEMAQTIINY